MSNIPFFNHLGDIILVPGAPSFLDDDCVPDAELQSLLQNTSQLLGKTPTASLIRAASGNLTLEVIFHNDLRVIGRKILPRNDIARNIWRTRKLRVEARLLAWLQTSNAHLPVPRLLSPVDVLPLDEVHPDFFFVTEKLPGRVLLNQYGLLDTSAKERIVQSYARFTLDLFRIKVPQSIGSFVPAMSSELDNEIVPGIALHPYHPRQVFSNVRDYLDSLLKMKSCAVKGDDAAYIDELGEHIHSLLDNLESKSTADSLLRCVLSHEDLNEQNILIDERGEITGVVDWEYQLVKPAFLAADYPPWLSYDACMDPRFADTYYTVWLESPQESKRLRDLYSQIVKARDQEYWDALVQGAALRSCLNWLVYMPITDDSCIPMKKWMDATFL
ncbi:hypothetical protein H0H87_002196 [Tephrocybe sp. NHM501043]|nr:hypothetical protein H0H87_002196 [Tephrocybe sp. NHM501043]